jgi:hypothetical protein
MAISCRVGLVTASNAARCVACHGVRSHPVPVAMVGECFILVVRKHTQFSDATRTRSCCASSGVTHCSNNGLRAHRENDRGLASRMLGRDGRCRITGHDDAAGGSLADDG